MSPLIAFVMIILTGGSIIEPFTAESAFVGDFKSLVHHECGFTRFPTLCVETLLTEFPGKSSTVDNNFIISALVNKTILETRLPASYFSRLIAHAEHEVSASNGNASPLQHAKSISDECEELLGMAVNRLEQSSEALKNSASWNKEDVQTYISAAITLQQACKDDTSPSSGSGHPGLETFGSLLTQKMDYLSELSSNALAVVNAQADSKSQTSSRTKNRGGFPSWVFGRERKLLQSKGVNADVVVAQDGSGDYETVTEAVGAASGGRFVIYVKSGVYKEKVHIDKDGITLIGDGKYSTVIDYGSSVAKGSSLRSSATITVTGDGFIARDIGFQNSAGPRGEQAVALTLASDRSVLYRCSLTGYQDTLYALILRQFYRECDISGTLDFIFGNAVAVFQSCNIGLRQPASGKPYNVVLANGRSDPGQNTGFSLQSCTIKSSASVKSYLGRPWKQYSRAVVMQSSIDGSVDPKGWVAWPGYGSSVLKSLYFGEYANQGPGAGTSGRVQWGGYHAMGAGEAEKFTVGNFIAGSSWLPSTGVTFVSGLH